MSKVEDFLTAAEEKDIIKAIKTAENNTSGEIRVHIEKVTEKPPIERALEVFYFLEMDKTNQRNGVLFYIAVESKKFAIIGDEGINSRVPDNFWDTAIIEVGNKLKEFFPYKFNDTNELSDEISKG